VNGTKGQSLGFILLALGLSQNVILVACKFDFRDRMGYSQKGTLDVNRLLNLGRRAEVFDLREPLVAGDP
jgi:hypothetical protein